MNGMIHYIKRSKMIKYEKGMKFGRLELVQKTDDKTRNRIWVCKCDCGSVIKVPTSHLSDGHTKSCGCYKNEVIKKHGLSKTRIHNEWIRMRFRCSGKNIEDYPSHSGRGIKVCEEWNDFTIFKDWALSNGYDDSLTIDRIDNDKGYSKDNCRWTTQSEQNRNTRRTIYITHNKETKLLIDWTREKNMSYNVTYSRYKKGWSFERIFSLKGMERKQ